MRVGSRQRERAAQVCAAIHANVGHARIEPVATGTPQELQASLCDRTLIISAGTAGVVLLPRSARVACSSLRVAIDLNAVPPLGIEGVELLDKGAQRDGAICYGAIGVGDTKMKVHKAAIARLFESNAQVMDAEEVYALATALP